jgi:hypothetical protein
MAVHRHERDRDGLAAGDQGFECPRFRSSIDTAASPSKSGLSGSRLDAIAIGEIRNAVPVEGHAVAGVVRF